MQLRFGVKNTSRLLKPSMAKLNIEQVVTGDATGMLNGSVRDYIQTEY